MILLLISIHNLPELLTDIIQSKATIGIVKLNKQPQMVNFGFPLRCVWGLHVNIESRFFDIVTTVL